MRWTQGTVWWMLAACGTSEPDVAQDTDGPGDTPEDVVRAPGRTALRRLNRAEYDNTIRDLLGTETRLGVNFPQDGATHGFDNVAEGLTVSPVWVELAEVAAARLSAEVLDRPLRSPIAETYEVEELDLRFDEVVHDTLGGRLGMYSGGTALATIPVPANGRYLFRARVWADQAGPENARMSLGEYLGAVEEFEVFADSVFRAEWVEMEIELTEGNFTAQMSFLNDFYVPGMDRNLYIDAVELAGPLDFTPEENPAWDEVMSCDITAVQDARGCARVVLEEFVPRAWRRPVQPREIDQLLALFDAVVEAGDPPSWGLEFALRAVLTSPHFLFLVELEPGAPGTPIDDFVLASRLSYLLWSSLPDDELLELAGKGELNDPEVLADQVERMLRDARAKALVDNFAGQWLMLRAVDNASPDFWTYPRFNEDLRTSMKTSMELFFWDFITEDLPLTGLLDGETAWVDGRLGGLYGIDAGGVGNTGFRRVDVGHLERRGWLTTPGLLMATSYPTRTSPVRRGVWVLTNLLCDEPDPPPADVPGFPDVSEEALTVRERLEAHRSNPACASCHQVMDPIGLSFERFDGIGQSRTADNGEPIDDVGVLPDGTTYDGVPGLAASLVADERFPACVVKNMFTYAHGRAPGAGDAAYVDDLVKAYVDGGQTMSALLTAIVTDDTFRLHGGAR